MAGLPLGVFATHLSTYQATSLGLVRIGQPGGWCLYAGGRCLSRAVGPLVDSPLRAGWGGRWQLASGLALWVGCCGFASIWVFC